VGTDPPTAEGEARDAGGGHRATPAPAGAKIGPNVRQRPFNVHEGPETLFRGRAASEGASAAQALTVGATETERDGRPITGLSGAKFPGHGATVMERKTPSPRRRTMGNPPHEEAKAVPDSEWQFGKIEPEELPDFTPIEFTLFGYDQETLEEQAFTFHARATMPFGGAYDAFRATNEKGRVNAAVAARFLGECLLEEEQEEWDSFIHSKTIHIKATAITEITTKLMEHYGAGDGERPTPPRSARRGGQRQTGGTATVKHSGRVSTSSRSASATP
jgi:hypothetical protein